MKKFFAKYLPVKGEVKKGDMFIVKVDSLPQTAYPCTGIVKDKKYNSVFFENVAEFHQSRVQKVKLFLCSRDYKIGDRVKIDVLLNGIYNNFTFEEEGEEDGIKYQMFEGTGIYNHYPEHDKELNIFKVIGEISPEATWVKEGDEFDENDIEFVSLGWCGNPLEGTPEDNDFVQIKGPCGHFH